MCNMPTNKVRKRFKCVPFRRSHTFYYKIQCVHRKFICAFRFAVWSYNTFWGRCISNYSSWQLLASDSTPFVKCPNIQYAASGDWIKQNSTKYACPFDMVLRSAWALDLIAFNVLNMIRVFHLLIHEFIHLVAPPTLPHRSVIFELFYANVLSPVFLTLLRKTYPDKCNCIHLTAYRWVQFSQQVTEIHKNFSVGSLTFIA